MQWNKTPCSMLQRNIRSVQNQEQTLELRLPDGMPDIGRVLCAWGQPVLRSKEWRSDSMVVSGGVTGTVLYDAEDGSGPKSMECWLPLQAKWSFPESKREGTIRTCMLLRSMDARALSSRKLIVRAAVGILGEALEPAEATIYTPEDVPADVQILENTYPVNLPKEAGEKLFLLDEEVMTDQPAAKLIAWDIEPVLEEQTVVGSRAVFKGVARLHLVFMGEDGKLHSGYYDLPFAQYAELDRDYDKEATASAMLAVSSLEPELSEGHLRVKCGLVAQYMVYDCEYVKLCEDAYSPCRPVEAATEQLELPALLDRFSRNVDLQQNLQADMVQVADAVLYPDHPMQYREGDEVVLELPGVMQILGYDAEGKLQARTENRTERVELPAAPGCNLWVQVRQPVPLTAEPMGDKLQVGGQLQLELEAASQQSIPMVTALEVGQETQPDPGRPTLILKRMEDMSLWELAKGCGSTVEAIKKANQLSAEPMPGQMLLIPVC